MTQDRRKDENRPTEALVFTDEKLIAAAKAHLEAERTEGCLLAMPNIEPALFVAAGPASWIAKHTASQSQAVPSELASLTRYGLTMHEAGFDYLERREEGSWVKFSDVQSLFSYSAATGKVPEAYAKAMRDMIRVLRGVECGDDSQWKFIANVCENAEELLASPAAPLAGKAEAKGLLPIRSIHYLDAVGNRVNLDILRGVPGEYGSEITVSAPLAAAVPAEEATIVVQPGNAFIAPPGYKVQHAPAGPAPIQASALTNERIIEIADQTRTAESRDGDYILPISFAREIEKELARLSTPTAQGTASRPNADCSGEPSNCPDNEGYGCACGYGAPVAADAAVTAQSIDTQEFRELMCHLGYWVDEDDAWNDECGLALVEFIDRQIATHAQAPAGRDAQQWISVDERLPEPMEGRMFSEEVLVIHMNSNWPAPRTSRLHFEEDGPTVWSGGDPTHWMPLPAAPQSKSEG